MTVDGKHQVPEDPDVVLVPQRNGCQVEIVGGVAHATALQVRSFLQSLNICFQQLITPEDDIEYKMLKHTITRSEINVTFAVEKLPKFLGAMIF